jgi:hypothetical protein
VSHHPPGRCTWPGSLSGCCARRSRTAAEHLQETRLHPLNNQVWHYCPESYFLRHSRNPSGCCAHGSTIFATPLQHAGQGIWLASESHAAAVLLFGLTHSFMKSPFSST